MHLRARRLPFVSLPLWVSLLPACAHAQTTYPGRLDPGLHVDVSTSTTAVLDPIPLEEAKRLGVDAAPGDKLFSGELPLPRGGGVRYKVILVRPSNGTDSLYIDKDRSGDFQEGERVLFHAPVKSSDPRLKSSADFDVDLEGQRFTSCPVEVGLLQDNVPSPAHADQLAVLYTTAPYIQGEARLPHRNLLVRFEYDFDKQDVVLNHAREWVDLNGDGQFDTIPGSGESLRSQGTPPVFHIGERTLQVQSIDLNAGQFTLVSLPTSVDQRTPSPPVQPRPSGPPAQ